MAGAAATAADAWHYNGLLTVNGWDPYANFSDWDICAGDVLVTEAGGGVSEIAGTPIKYGTAGYSQTGGLLATNGRIHEAAVAGLRR